MFASSASQVPLTIEFLRSKISQLYTQNATAYIQLFYYIENIDFYQKRKDFLIWKTRILFVLLLEILFTKFVLWKKDLIYFAKKYL